MKDGMEYCELCGHWHEPGGGYILLWNFDKEKHDKICAHTLRPRSIITYEMWPSVEEENVRWMC